MSTNVELTDGSPIVKHSRSIERLVRTSTLSDELEDGYRAMALDEAREAEALAWAEATIDDGAHYISDES